MGVDQCLDGGGQDNFYMGGDWPDVEPVAVHKPYTVPKHWQDQVKEGLEKDVRMGIIEEVPVNTPTMWCSRMVCVPKHTGEPRRTVDFKVTLQNGHRCP